MKRSTGWVIGVALLISACGRTPVYTERYYRLDSVLSDVTAMVEAPDLLVEPFEAHGIYAERPLVYQRPEGRGALEQFSYVFWSEQPARMLSDDLSNSLRRAFGEARVHARSSRVRAQYVVRPRLRRLDFVITAEGARAEFAAEFVVTNEARQPRFVLEYARSRELPEVSAQSFADTAGALAAEASRQLIERLSEAFVAERASGS